MLQQNSSKTISTEVSSITSEKAYQKENYSVSLLVQLSIRKIKSNSVITTLILVILFTIFDFWHLFNVPFAVGIDGYYYVLQVESLFNDGKFYFFTYTPLILYFLAGLKFFFGNAIFSIKIGALLLHVILNLGIFSLVKSCTRNIWLSILALALVWLSSLHLYMLVEYISFLGAICFIVWGIFFVVLALEKQKLIWSSAAVICFLIAVGCHRATIPIVLTLTISLLLLLWLRFAIEANNNLQRILSLATIILLIFAPAFLVVQPFFHLPLEWNKEFTILPRIPARLANLPEVLILLVLCPLMLLLVTRWKKKMPNKIGQIIFGTVALWSILITLNPFISSQLGFLSLGGRLRMLAYIQVALIVPGIIWLLSSIYRTAVWYVPALVAPLMIWSCFFNPLPRGAQAEYLTQRAKLIDALKMHSQEVEKDSLIVADHGEQFVVTAVTGIASQQEFPEDSKYQTVYWLLNKIPPTLVDSSMLTIMKDSDGQHTVLVKDSEQLRQRIQNLEIRYPFLKNNRHLNIYLSKSSNKH
jgi:hypothetical protein